MNSHRLGAVTGLLCALVLALMVTALPSAGAKTPEPPRPVNPQDADGFFPHARLAIFFRKRKKSLRTWICCQLRGESIDFQGARDIFLRGHR